MNKTRLEAFGDAVIAIVITIILNKQIGRRLHISEITVKAHRGRVMRKMHADSLADLVKMAAALELPSAKRRSGLHRQTADI